MMERVSETRKLAKFGIVGGGSMGILHARAVARNSEFELVGVAEPRTERREQLEADFGFPTFESSRALKDRGAEFIVVATPNELHGIEGIRAIEAGCHVLVEKPIASTSAEARALISAATTHNRVLAVGHIERFNPAVVAARGYLQGHTIRALAIERAGPRPSRTTTVGVMLDIGVHDLDLVRYLTGHEIESIHSVLGSRNNDVEDIALILARSSGGALAQINVNWLTHQRIRRLTITTESENLIVDLMNRTVVRHFEFDGFSYRVTPLNVAPTDPITEEQRDLVSSAATGGRPKANAEDGLASLELALQCIAGFDAHSIK